MLQAADELLFKNEGLLADLQPLPNIYVPSTIHVV